MNLGWLLDYWVHHIRLYVACCCGIWQLRYKQVRTEGKTEELNQLANYVMTICRKYCKLSLSRHDMGIHVNIWKYMPTILYYSILYYIISYYIILYHIISYYIILYYITVYCIILYYIILHYIILYFTILYCILLYYITCENVRTVPPQQVSCWQFLDWQHNMFWLCLSNLKPGTPKWCRPKCRGAASHSCVGGTVSFSPERLYLSVFWW